MFIISSNSKYCNSFYVTSYVLTHSVPAGVYSCIIFSMKNM